MKTKDYTVAEAIASTCEAIRNCQKSGNEEWRLKHHATLRWIERQFLPSGSGVDSGTTIDDSLSGPSKIVLHLGYHHMDDVGVYDGWTEHTVTVRPTFTGRDIRISGRDHNGIKEYLAEIIDCALGEVCQRIDYARNSNEYGWLDGADEWHKKED